MDVQNANIFEVGMLNEREAINLLENQSGKKVDTGEYKPVVDKLLRKCGGLPLAIVATASALRGKDLSAWCRFAEESEKPISGQVSSEYRETYSILETSYKLIEIEEKRMFFFLACLSPLDTAISVDDLMRYGIGLDLFQHLNNLSEAMERAHGWANELVSSSLLIKDGDYEQVKIHDVVRASAISFAEKGKGRLTLVESIPRWICKEAFEKLTAISLLSGCDFSALSGVKAPMLQILLLKGDLLSTTLTANFFEGMTNLKVLSVSNLNFKLGLPESMGQLEFLKTLHLHHYQLKDIKLIGKLVNLLVLSLRDSSLEELPDEIRELCNLRLLDMEGCKGNVSIHTNILSRLSCLEGIYMLNSFNDWASENIEADDGGADNKASISEFNKLSHLNVLEMDVPRHAQLLTLNDSRLVNQLGKFTIHVGGFQKWDNDKVQGFRHVLRLKDMSANGDKFLRALLNKTDYLQISNCQSDIIKNFVPQLDDQGFKDLKYLQVDSCHGVEFVVSSDKHNKSMAFANLENLNLSVMRNLTAICEGKAPAGIFCNLKYLILSRLQELKYGLPLTSVPLNLVEVSIEYCQSLELIAFEDVSELSDEEEVLLKKEPDTVWLPYLKSLKEDGRKSLSGILGQSGTIDDVRDAGKSFFNSKSKFPSLESLRMSVNDSNVTLWSRECHVSSFQNLKVLDIYQSDKLRSFGSPSLFAALVQLEELLISNCSEFQEVITEETEGYEIHEPVIVFPLLKRLSMNRLWSVKRFYGGSYKLEFPILRSLVITETPSLTNSDGSENLTALFSDKIVFPCLEEMNVQNVSDKVVRLWNWSSSDVQAESESASISLNSVPNLQKLTLLDTPGQMSIPPFVSHNLSHLEFVKFSNNKTLFSTSSVNREALWRYSQVPKLEILSVRESDSLEILFENEDDAAAMRLCRQLTEISLSSIPELKLIPLHHLKNIRSLSLSFLRWEYVFLADLFVRDREQLQLLENLEIHGCLNMKVVIKDESVDGEVQVYAFPRLKSLYLGSLRIRHFANGNGSALHFPSLERLELNGCIEIHSFCSGPFVAPKLKQVELSDCDQLGSFLSENMADFHELPSLETVTVSNCEELLSFSSVPLTAPKLHDVGLLECPKLMWFSPGDPNHDNLLDLASLEKVSIGECPQMHSFSTGGIKAPKLSELKVDDTDFSKRANDELEILLASLYTCNRSEEDDDDDDDDEEEDEDEEEKEDEEEEEEE